MKKSTLARTVASLALATAPLFAFAQATSDSNSGSTATNSNVNNPTFIYSPTGGGAASSGTAGFAGPTVGFNSTDQRFQTNQAATPGTVFVNPPAAETCARAGNGFAVQGVGAGLSASIGGVESVKCDMRADTINLKVTGAPQEVIKARQCMDAQMAEAYARAGQPCEDRRAAERKADAGAGAGAPAMAQPPQPAQQTQPLALTAPGRGDAILVGIASVQ